MDPQDQIGEKNSASVYEDRPGEECGLFGVFGCPDAARIIYDGLFSQQHRGQEGAGIATSDSGKIRCLKGLGLLSQVFPSNRASELKGNLGIGHVRYSTTGGGAIAHNVQPLIGDCVDGRWAVAHNGNIVNAHELRRLHQESGALFQTGTDSEMFLHLLAAPEYRKSPKRVAHACEALCGAYSFLIMSRDRLYAARDPHGFKPLVMGRLGGGWVFASETCAFTQIGAEYEREIEPGELVTVDSGGIASTRLSRVGAGLSHCVFEIVYFSRPDSRVFGHNVHQVRVSYGERLAEEYPVEADIVVAVPDSGNSAALGYARKSGIPYEMGFIRNHYVGRTFIMPGHEERASQADKKLAAMPETVRGKRVIVVDDSIVRGTTMRRRVRILREAGARQVHLRISCPPVAHPCYYGIDFPTPDELIASSKSVEEIRKYMDADSLGYLSVSGLLSPFADKRSYCIACFDGAYPIETGCGDKGILDEPEEPTAGYDP
ncbi:MAG: amidophosphoribosyltransferase [Planctomycetota bacterium]|jgi:amidophosphoribosyltransferase|nr:amidophosphoribosyltransferase [Planctomycetota bacterium]